MRARAFLALLALTLAACGADGEPERPGGVEPGLTVSGSVEFGITGGSR